MRKIGGLTVGLIAFAATGAAIVVPSLVAPAAASIAAGLPTISVNPPAGLVSAVLWVVNS